jgi:hypothetical protein
VKHQLVFGLTDMGHSVDQMKRGLNVAPPPLAFSGVPETARDLDLPLLQRLEPAVGLALTEDIFTDEVNAPPGSPRSKK